MKTYVLNNACNARAALIVLVATSLGCAAAIAGSTEDGNVPGEGEGLFQERCAVCHDGGIPGIPTRETLGSLSSDYVVTALTDGLMFEQAYGLSSDQIRSIADYVTNPAN
jgi:polyvinyl alcohol dehydrogenase (cytochrome)